MRVGNVDCFFFLMLDCSFFSQSRRATNFLSRRFFSLLCPQNNTSNRRLRFRGLFWKAARIGERRRRCPVSGGEGTNMMEEALIFFLRPRPSTLDRLFLTRPFFSLPTNSTSPIRRAPQPLGRDRVLRDGHTGAFRVIVTA